MPKNTLSNSHLENKPRVSFANLTEPLVCANLLDVQKQSYRWLIGETDWDEYDPVELSSQELLVGDAKVRAPEVRDEQIDATGIEQLFATISPVRDAGKTMSLEFTAISFEPPTFTPEECRKNGLTYSSKIYVRAEFYYEVTGERKAQTIFLGDFPLMTIEGSFIINGIERVVVSQIVRSPGVYFNRSIDKQTGNYVYQAMIIPSRGTWLEFEIDKRDIISVRIDRRRKIPIGTFLSALEGGISKEFAEYPLLYSQKDSLLPRSDALKDIYRRVRPGDPVSEMAGEALLRDYYFNPRRYDLARVGRYKINKKLGTNINEKVLTLNDIRNTIKYLLALKNEETEFSGVYQNETEGEGNLRGRTVRIDVDDIDHFGNRRIRPVGELVQVNLRGAILRIERTIMERMATMDPATITPASLVNARPFIASLKEFFGTSQMSQFMDQNNPLAGLTHKRRLSALGPGGLSRDRAGVEVRDVHPSHYGRMCPIETPEGPNIGLIGSLATFARVNSYGFIETPYRVVKDGVVTDVVEYLDADAEYGHYIAQAQAPVDENGKFLDERVLCRISGQDPKLVLAKEVSYMDVSARQMVSVGTSLIPFLEHDDANRALMGANMQRQAVPLLRTEAPLVGTGMERRAALDSHEMVVAKEAGEVTYASADRITVKNQEGKQKDYNLHKFIRSNPGNCINDRVIINVGDEIQEGQVIADGPATSQGELALGRNLLVAYMPCEGLNYEDAIVLSRRVVEEDLLTSIHIEEYEIDARDTKLGPEEITRDIPNVSEDTISNLDKKGIIRIGAEVQAGDIIVGKVSPKGESELTSEERLLRAIFGENKREVRDTSLRVPHGEGGIVIDVREIPPGSPELDSGVLHSVKVFVAQRRKITIGDKMAGRHGNKGIVSKILPPEDMPFLADGTPVDIILNPMGIPGRMNVGQVLECHLGWIAHEGWDATKARQDQEDWALKLPEGALSADKNTTVATPVFDGLQAESLLGLLAVTLPNRDGDRLVDENGKTQLFDGKTGEPFPYPIAVGYKYMLKLHHLVDDKIHARSTGPYSMITQQPLGGKAQFGGQRFGEMEVWALEAYGAAYALQELLTVKSDDVDGRVRAYDSIVRGHDIPEPGVPESFRVLVQEMRSLCLNIEALDSDGQVVDIDAEEEQLPQIEEKKQEPQSLPLLIQDPTETPISPEEMMIT